MSVISGHFRLSAEQKRFKDMLAHYLRLTPFWDFEKREYDAPALDKALGVLSHSERLMAEFFAAVWSGDNAYDFDFIDAARTLEPDHRRVVVEWLDDPYFP